MDLLTIWTWITWIGTCLWVCMPIEAYEIDIFSACAAGDLARVQAIVTSDPGTVSLKRVDGYTPGEIALENKQAAIADYLFAHGADPNFADHTGRPYLLTLLHQHRWGEAQALAERGADVMKRGGPLDENGFEVLLTQRMATQWIAGEDEASRQRYGFVKKTHIARSVNVSDKSNWLACLDSFLAHAERIDPEFLAARVALQQAVESKNLGMLKRLYQCGAKLSPVEFNTPRLFGGIQVSQLSDMSPQVLEFLMDQELDPTLLLPMAVQQGDVGRVHFLLERGADILGAPYAAQKNANWESAPILAVKSPQMLKLFFDCGLTVDPKSNEACNLLCLACNESDTAALQLLLQRGLDPNVKGAAGGSPIEYASAGGNAPAVALLRSKGSNWRIYSSIEPKMRMVPYAAMNLKAFPNRISPPTPGESADIYQALLGYPSWIPALALVLSLVVVGRWIQRRQARQYSTSTQKILSPVGFGAIPGIQAGMAYEQPSSTSAGPEIEWQTSDSVLSPRQAHRLTALQNEQAQLRRNLPLAIVNALALIVFVMIDPLLSQSTLEFLLDTQNFQPRDSAMRNPVDPGSTYALYFALGIGCLGIFAAAFAWQMTKYFVRTWMCLLTVSSLMIASLASVCAYGFIRWMPDPATIVLMLLQVAVALVFSVTGVRALCYQAEIRQLEKDRDAYRVTRDLRTDVDVPPGWDQG